MIVILFGGAFVDFQIGKSLLMSLGYVAISFVWGFLVLPILCSMKMINTMLHSLVLILLSLGETKAFWELLDLN